MSIHDFFKVHIQVKKKDNVSPFIICQIIHWSCIMTARRYQRRTCNTDGEVIVMVRVPYTIFL